MSDLLAMSCQEWPEISVVRFVGACVHTLPRHVLHVHVEYMGSAHALQWWVGLGEASYRFRGWLHTTPSSEAIPFVLGAKGGWSNT